MSFHTTRPINLMCSGGLRTIIHKKKMPESFHMSVTHCAADYFFFCFVTTTKYTAFHTVFKKVSFGQPARQDSDKGKVTIHWKTIPYQETLVFRVYFSSSIMELQKCSLANPCREALEQSHVYSLGPEALDQRYIWLLTSGFN